MSTITTIQSTDAITNSRSDINTNFANLNTDKFETSNIDIDTSLAANSDTKVASQKATKAYVDAAGGQTFLVPTGTIIPYGGGTTPTNFLPCDGTAISRSTYSTLFGVIGTRFGAGDGSTTFNVPNRTSSGFSSNNQQYLNLASASTQYADRASPTGLSFTTDFSIATYVNLTTLPSSSKMGICCKSTGSGNQNSWIFCIQESTGIKLNVGISSNGSSVTDLVSIVFPMVINQWYHFAVSYVASTGIASFYVDGKKISQASGGPSSVFSSTSNFIVGSIDAGAHGSLINGNLANLHCYNAALTTAQIQYTTSPGFYQTNLQGFWAFDNAYTDASGNSNTLTSHGSPVFTNGFSIGASMVPAYIKT